MIYKWVNSIITLNSQVAELVDADHNKIGLQYGLKVTYHTGSNPVLTTKQ
jgi:hypothetical protein